MVKKKKKKLTSGGDFLTGGGDADDDTLTPTFVTGLEGGTHDADVPGAIKRVIATAIGHVDQLGLDTLGAESSGIQEVGGPELLAPGLLAIVDVDDDDLPGPVPHGAQDDGQTDTAGAEDGHVGASLDVGRDDGGPVAGGDATS